MELGSNWGQTKVLHWLPLYALRIVENLLSDSYQPKNISSFAEHQTGELYALSYDGGIYAIAVTAAQ